MTNNSHYGIMTYMDDIVICTENRHMKVNALALNIYLGSFRRGHRHTAPYKPQSHGKLERLDKAHKGIINNPMIKHNQY
jgi:hypothetical protein